RVDYRLDTPKEVADAFLVKLRCGLSGGMLVANPIPDEYAMDADFINRNIDEAISQANEKGILGKQITPFLLDKIQKLTGGDSLKANIQLVYNNAKLGAEVACAMAEG
ncbi:MAG: pseudouridine-5'-phosphate glycosidase, partial [Clostridia bacterium]